MTADMVSAHDMPSHAQQLITTTSEVLRCVVFTIEVSSVNVIFRSQNKRKADNTPVDDILLYPRLLRSTVVGVYKAAKSGCTSGLWGIRD